jgi:hypothetical protein
MTRRKSEVHVKTPWGEAETDRRWYSKQVSFARPYVPLTVIGGGSQRGKNRQPVDRGRTIKDEVIEEQHSENNLS